jgi:hypothetical protein
MLLCHYVDSALNPVLSFMNKQKLINVSVNLYRCAMHLDINVYVHQLMHLFIYLS